MCAAWWHRGAQFGGAGEVPLTELRAQRHLDTPRAASMDLLEVMDSLIWDHSWWVDYLITFPLIIPLQRLPGPGYMKPVSRVHTSEDAAGAGIFIMVMKPWPPPLHPPSAGSSSLIISSSLSWCLKLWEFAAFRRGSRTVFKRYFCRVQGQRSVTPRI